jgi:hypothetical protein
MPIYEYECLDGHINERILTIKEMESKYFQEDLTCCVKINKYGELDENGDNCGLLLHKVQSTFNTTQVGKPSLIFRNPKTGAIQVSTHEYQVPPSGFVKEELRNPAERTKFEKEYNERMRVQDEIQTEKRRLETSDSQKNRQDDLKSRLSSIAAKSENPSMTESLVKNAMKRNRKKERVPKKKTNFHFEVN